MRGNKGACFTSNKDDWGTPQWLFDDLNYRYGPFDYDLCASDDNHKCEKYFTKENSVFINNFEGNVFCNPPYGHKFINSILDLIFNKIDRNFVSKAVLLLPSSTSNEWFSKLIHSSLLHKIMFVNGRIKFEGAGTGAPFSSIIVILEKNNCGAEIYSYNVRV